MPTTARLTIDVNIPTPTDYLAAYPKLPFDSRLEPVKEMLCEPANIYDMLVATNLGRTAIEAVAAKIHTVYQTLPAHTRPEWDFVKQRAGALVAVILQHNGYAKTGTKQAVPVDGWNRAELYHKED